MNKNRKYKQEKRGREGYNKKFTTKTMLIIVLQTTFFIIIT